MYSIFKQVHMNKKQTKKQNCINHVTKGTDFNYIFNKNKKKINVLLKEDICYSYGWNYILDY